MFAYPLCIFGLNNLWCTEENYNITCDQVIVWKEGIRYTVRYRYYIFVMVDKLINSVHYFSLLDWRLWKGSTLKEKFGNTSGE